MNILPNNDDPKSGNNVGGDEEHFPTPSQLFRITIDWLIHWWDSPHEKSKPADWAMVALTVGIAGAAFWSVCVFQGQLTQARRANELIETQWREQQRPWVGLSGALTFAKQPMFQVFLNTTPHNTGVDLETVFKVKNFGASPAFKTASGTQAYMAENVGVDPPQLQMQLACNLADGRGENGTGSVLFPTGEITVDYEMMYSQAKIDFNQIRRIWVMTCISYRMLDSEIVRHTKFWIASFMIPEKSTPKIVERLSGATLFTLPITGWQMMRNEAD